MVRARCTASITAVAMRGPPAGLISTWLAASMLYPSPPRCMKSFVATV